MAKKGVDVQTSASQLTNSGLSSKTVTDVIVYRHGSVMVFEIVFSGGSAFLKQRDGQVDIGGTIDWGTGTIPALV